MNGQKNEELTKIRKQTTLEEENIEFNNKDWIENEINDLESKKMDKIPSLIFEEDKLTEFLVDFNKPFDQWIDPVDGKIKKIIPVNHEGERKNLWLNIKNPLYIELLKTYVETNNNYFKVIQIGNNQNTKYKLIK